MDERTAPDLADRLNVAQRDIATAMDNLTVEESCMALGIVIGRLVYGVAQMRGAEAACEVNSAIAAKATMTCASLLAKGRVH